jgi:hypothetical protein
MSEIVDIENVRQFAQVRATGQPRSLMQENRQNQRTHESVYRWAAIAQGDAVENGGG